MEDNTLVSSPEDQSNERQQTGCAICNHPLVEHGYPTPLCSDCRKEASRLKVPNWIKFFAIGICILLVFSIFNLPRNIALALHMQKGKKAAVNNEYVTAQKEFSEVVKLLPNYLEGQGNLLTASFYNQDMETFLQMMQKLENKIIDDEDLLAKMDYVVDKARAYFPSDSLGMLAENYRSIDSVPDAEMVRYISSFPEEIYPRLVMAGRYFDRKQYKDCDSLCNHILNLQYDYVPILNVKATLKRLLDQPDSSLYFCEMIIQNNKESVWAWSAKARTMLYMHRDAEGLQLARKAYDMNKQNGYALATLALAYHLAGKEKEKQDIFRQVSSLDSVNNSYMEYVRDVISGKEIFRK